MVLEHQANRGTAGATNDVGEDRGQQHTPGRPDRSGGNHGAGSYAHSYGGTNGHSITGGYSDVCPYSYGSSYRYPWSRSLTHPVTDPCTDRTHRYAGGHSHAYAGSADALAHSVADSYTDSTHRYAGGDSYPYSNSRATAHSEPCASCGAEAYSDTLWPRGCTLADVPPRPSTHRKKRVQWT